MAKKTKSNLSRKKVKKASSTKKFSSKVLKKSPPKKKSSLSKRKSLTAKKSSPKKKKSPQTLSAKVLKSKPAQNIDEAALNEMIRTRAYFIWEEKGRPFGFDQENWQQAEQEIKAQLGF